MSLHDYPDTPNEWTRCCSYTLLVGQSWLWSSDADDSLIWLWLSISSFALLHWFYHSLIQWKMFISSPLVLPTLLDCNLRKFWCLCRRACKHFSYLCCHHTYAPQIKSLSSHWNRWIHTIISRRWCRQSSDHGGLHLGGPKWQKVSMCVRGSLCLERRLLTRVGISSQFSLVLPPWCHPSWLIELLFMLPCRKGSRLRGCLLVLAYLLFIISWIWRPFSLFQVSWSSSARCFLAFFIVRRVGLSSWFFVWVCLSRIGWFTLLVVTFLMIFFLVFQAFMVLLFSPWILCILSCLMFICLRQAEPPSFSLDLLVVPSLLCPRKDA